MEPSLAREAQGFPSALWRACPPINEVVGAWMILFPAAIPSWILLSACPGFTLAQLRCRGSASGSSSSHHHRHHLTIFL